MLASEYIKDLNNKIKAEGLNWKAAVTGISIEDGIAMCGYNPRPDELSFEERMVVSQLRFNAGEHFIDLNLPSSVDHSVYMSPVKDQGKCGSCVAFGTIAAIEGVIRFQRKDPNYSVDLSEAHLFYCHAASEGRTCGDSLLINPWKGWVPERALIAFKQKGVVDQTCFPYDPFSHPQQCKLCSNWATSLTFITSYRKVSSISEMKSELVRNGPLISCMWVFDDFMSYSGFGVYSHVGISLAGHCVCIVGYDDANQCWIAKNSWGPRWGNNGFFRIQYGSCFIDYEMWAPYVN